MMWHNIKEKLPKVGATVEVEIKAGPSIYGVFVENDLNLYFKPAWGDYTMGLNEIKRWRYEPMIRLF